MTAARRARRQARQFTFMSVVGRAAYLALLITSAACGAQLETDDGLAVRLDETTGAVQSVQVDGAALPLADGPGGLWVQEFRRLPDDRTQERLMLDLHVEPPSWRSAVMADWDADERYAERAPDGTFLRIGDGLQPGAGMAAAEPFPLRPGELAHISWRARADEPGGTLILCLRLFDEHGGDVTEQVSPPSGWTHSPYSNAHYHMGFTLSTQWSRHSYDYTAPHGVASALLSLRVYRDGALHADIADLRVRVRPGGWGEELPVRGPIITGEGAATQSVTLRGLRLETVYRARGDRLSVEVSVASVAPEAEARNLRLTWRLPIALAGWRWNAGPEQATTIEAGRRYEDPVAFAGHPTGRYPLATVMGEETALCMATSLDPPVLQGFHCDERGLATSADLALSPLAPNAPARFGLVLYRHAPEWGFRAALERYYEMFPALFAGRAGRGGCWTLRLPDLDTEAVEDFGLAFYQCHFADEQTRAWCRRNSLSIFRYIEPWGVRQTFPDAQTRGRMPPYEERLAELRAWAAQDRTEALWLGTPRNVMAQAVLNSMIMGADGRAVFYEDLYTHWACWWQTSTDPDLPSPNRADVCRQTQIDPALPWADGVYVDSVSARHASQESHRADHLAAADMPLTFSLATGEPIVLSGLAHAKFLTWLRGYLHERGKLMMFNLFAPATRLYGHLPDITGCETAGPQSDESAMAQRIYARHRPVSNLLQWQFAVLTRVPAMTADQMREYFDNQLLYGFWPGISTAGGGTEPGYAAMHRYFRDTELLERDRELFRRYIPLFDALNEAGWEPVPYMRAEPDGLRIERFGESLLVVHNSSYQSVAARLLPDPGWWGDPGRVRLEHVGGGEDTLQAHALTLRPRSSVVLRLVPD